MKSSLFSRDLEVQSRQHLRMLRGMIKMGAAVLPAVILVILTCTTSCRHADIPSGNSEASIKDWFEDPPPIDIAALTRTNLTDIIIANRVTKIGCNAFSNYKDVAGIIIPASVTEIKSNAFEGCTTLTNILVDSENPKFCSMNGVLFNKERTRLILCPNGKSGSYTIPDGVVEIGSCAFIGCTSLTKIIIPDTVTYIGYTAFSNCERLNSIVVSSSVVDIEFNAFDRCAGLTNILVDIDNAEFSSADGVLYNKGKTRLILCPIGKSGTYTLPAEVTKIEPGALGDCTGLTNILVDANNAAFSSVDGVLFNKGRTSLILCPRGRSGSYTIPEGVSEIATGAFSNCPSLTNISIPEGVAKIGGYAFWECTALTGIAIPDTVTYIGEKAFFLCRRLTNIAIPKGVTTIEDGTFYACMELASITIPEGVTQIGRLAFYDCRSLTSIVLPNSVNVIEDDAFTGCSSMTNITTSGRIDRIGPFAFSYCPGLTSIPKGVTNYWGSLIPRRDWPGRNRPLQ